MREVNANDFFSDIKERQQEVNQRAFEKFGSIENKKRLRPRDVDEQKCLDEICRNKWQQAIKEGKIKYLNDGEMDYHVY